MLRIGFIAGVILGAVFLWVGGAQAQTPVFCWPGSGSIAQSSPCSASNPLAVSAVITPAGTQNVNLTQVLGAAPSATNPIWVSPATASTPWTVTGSGTAGTAAAGVVTVQGIASMTPLLAAGTGTAGTAATGVLTVQGITSMTPLLATGTGTAGTAATGVVTVQGIGSMTPLLATLSGTNNINTVTAVTGITNTVNVAVIGNSFVNITTNTDTNVKGSAGTLAGISVNTAGVTSAVQIFNDADGTCSSGLIGTFSTLAQTFIELPAAATIGLCAKTTGGTPADITVYYR